MILANQFIHGIAADLTEPFVHLQDITLSVSFTDDGMQVECASLLLIVMKSFIETVTDGTR
mgnify:CR=1 FL=1